MATRIQFRRGTSSQHASFTGSVGEMTVDTDKDCLVVHDGSTAGGFEMLRSNLSNIDVSGTETAGKVIQSDGDGTYSWTGGGKILQVVNLDYTTVFYSNISTNNQYFDVTGFSSSITPTSTSSRVLVLVTIGKAGTYSNAFRVVRGSTPIGVGSSGSAFSGGFQGGTDGGTHGTAIGTHIVDSPATTSTVTYKIQGAHYNTSYAVAVNRGSSLSSNTYQGAYYSSMILMEIGP